MDKELLRKAKTAIEWLAAKQYEREKMPLPDADIVALINQALAH